MDPHIAANRASASPSGHLAPSHNERDASRRQRHNESVCRFVAILVELQRACRFGQIGNPRRWCRAQYLSSIWGWSASPCPLSVPFLFFFFFFFFLIVFKLFQLAESSRSVVESSLLPLLFLLQFFLCGRRSSCCRCLAAGQLGQLSSTLHASLTLFQEKSKLGLVRVQFCTTNYPRTQLRTNLGLNLLL